MLPEGRQGRALALGLLAIVLVVAWLGLGAPLLGWYRSRAIALGEQQQLAAHMEAVAASLPAMRAAAGRARQVPAAGAVLSGASDAIAAAALQGAIEQIARGVGASLASVAILPAEPAGQWRRIGLRLEVRAPYAVIVRLLAAASQGAPPMLVDDLSLTGSALEGPGVAAVLDAALTVYAFRRDGTPRPAPEERQALAQ